MFLAAALASGSSNSTINDVEPGLLGFLVVAGIGIALVFLLRSMNKQFKKIGPRPEDQPDPAADDSQSAAVDAGSINTSSTNTSGAAKRG
jgi:hypothetical protein